MKKMKRWSWLVVVLAVFVAGTVFAQEYKVQRKAGDYLLDIKMDKGPPVVGANNIEIVVTDKGGKAVTDAKVLVTVSMPAMPGIPAVENKAEAKPDDGKYKAKIDLSKGGSWNVSVRIIQGGKTSTAKFTVDVG
jgi:nitrogen fixation protein FixH